MKVEVSPARIVGVWIPLGTVVIAAVSWFLTANLRHEVTQSNAEAVQILTKQEELRQLLWGESYNKRIGEVFDKEAELGLGNGRPSGE